jgi:hypothetical protein
VLKTASSFVLASLRDSTYRSVRLASALAAAALDSRFEHPAHTSSSQPFQFSVSKKTRLGRSLATALLGERVRYSRHRQVVSNLHFEIQRKGGDDLVEGFWLF